MKIQKGAEPARGSEFSATERALLGYSKSIFKFIYLLCGSMLGMEAVYNSHGPHRVSIQLEQEQSRPLPSSIPMAQINSEGIFPRID